MLIKGLILKKTGVIPGFLLYNLVVLSDSLSALPVIKLKGGISDQPFMLEVGKGTITYSILPQRDDSYDQKNG